MFQKEVANRIISDFNSTDYGRLSILSNWKLEIKKICDIKPTSFFPKPKVDSSLLFFTPKKKFFELKDPKNLEHVTNVFFSQRRKMLKSSLKDINGKKILEELNISPNLRPENISIIEFCKIAKKLSELNS